MTSQVKRQTLGNDRQTVIDRIEAKYTICNSCGKKGIKRNKKRCFYCGDKK